MLRLLYRVTTWSLEPLAIVYLERRRKRGKEDARRFRERQGCLLYTSDAADE